MNGSNLVSWRGERVFDVPDILSPSADFLLNDAKIEYKTVQYWISIFRPLSMLSLESIKLTVAELLPTCVLAEARKLMRSSRVQLRRHGWLESRFAEKSYVSFKLNGSKPWAAPARSIIATCTSIRPAIGDKFALRMPNDKYIGVSEAKNQLPNFPSWPNWIGCHWRSFA